MPDIWIDVDTALSEAPVNLMPLVVAAGTTIDDGVTYDEAGIDLNWNFITTAGAFSQTNVVPTTGGTHDWASLGNGMYSIEIPASGGTINNDTEGFGWFSGFCTACLPWRGPVIGFRAAAINNSLIDGATVDVNVTAMANDVITPAAVDEDADFVIQALSITNALDAGSVLVDGTTTLTGNVSCGAGLDVVGALSANSVLVDTTTTLTGNVSCAGDFDVVGALSAGSILVDGTTALTGAVTAPAGIAANITGNITGDISGAVGTCAAATVSAIGANVITGTSLDATAATKIIDDFETQSQADPTGFHVNVLEVNGTAQTANDNGADINAILVDTSTTLENRLIAIEADTNELQADWANGGRLDLIQDIIAADTTTDIPALIATAQADLDIITAADGTTLSAASIAAIWDATEAITGQTHSFESILTKIYRYLMNDQNIVDATGVQSIRNEANGADIASRTITDDDTTTNSTDVVWV